MTEAENEISTSPVPYIVIDKRIEKVRPLPGEEEVITYLWGRDVHDYIIIKDENRIFPLHLMDGDLSEIRKKLKLF
jgi:hypothetical protein